MSNVSNEVVSNNNESVESTPVVPFNQAQAQAQAAPANVPSEVVAYQAAPVPTNQAGFNLNRVIATLYSLNSTTLRDYNEAFYADTAESVKSGDIAPIVKIFLDKAFADRWTEAHSAIAQLESDEVKLTLIHKTLFFFNFGVSGQRQYDAATRPAPEPKAPRVRATGGSKQVGTGKFKALSAKLSELALFAGTDASESALYNKLAAAFALPTAQVTYNTLLASPKAAVAIELIRRAETMIEDDKVREREAAEAAAIAEANSIADDIADLFA
jgi:hypothetical protein